jgi:hypothetical protein
MKDKGLEKQKEKLEKKSKKLDTLEKVGKMGVGKEEREVGEEE